MTQHRERSLLPAALLGLQALLLAWSGYRNSPTVDEPAHLAAGVSHWKLRRLDLYAVNPPLARSVAAIPVLWAKPETNWNAYRRAEETRAEFRIGRAFAEANGTRIFWLTTLARWACIPLVLLGGWVCWRWAGDLFGPRSGLVALLLWCLSPTVLGNGSLITADVSSASLGVAATYGFWRWLRETGWMIAVVAGVALGFALLAKTTLLLFFGLWPVMWIVDRRCDAGSKDRARRGVQAAQLSLMFLIALTCVNVGYGFEGAFRRLGSFRFVSEALAAREVVDTGQRFGNRFESSWVGEVPVPLPANYLIGIDRQRRDFEESKSRYFRGKIRKPGEPGWWWFYLYAAAVKVPLGTWLLAALAVPVALRGPRQAQCVLLLPVMAIVLLVSSQTGLNFFRYLLPAFPFAFIWVSQAAQHLSRGGAMLRVLVFAAMVSMVVSSLRVYPHSLSYFNELAGGPRNGFRLMNDANADWGQDLIFLRDWIREHPEARGMRLDYYGEVNPQSAGLAVSAVRNVSRETPADAWFSAIDTGNPRWYAISATHLVNRAAEATRQDEAAVSNPSRWARYLLTREPDARAGYSILIYRIGK